MEFMTIIKNSVIIFGYKDAIDILITSFVMYKLLALLRNSGVGQAIKAIVAFVVVTVVSGWLGLNLLYYLFSSAMQVGIIALVIVFQPEFRRILDQLGRSRLVSFLMPGAETFEVMATSITQIVEASKALSEERTGALIVFERETKLVDIAKTGISIEGEITAELIKNIFYPKSPLHDGAVIIRENKISSAACVLPLSENKKFNKNLGTRHRAAVGISEIGDNIAVVVSEETGIISVAVGGMLKRQLNARTYSTETLEKLLTQELIGDNTKKKTFFSKIITRRESEK